jgi:hypothetical protein
MSSYKEDIKAVHNSYKKQQSNDLKNTPFPSGVNPDVQTFLGKVLKNASDEDMNPVIRPYQNSDGNFVNEDGTLFKDFDYMSTLPSFDTLSQIGDKRYTLGHMLCAVFDKYLNRINTYAEVMQAGGCQIIENYICDADGIPIKQLQSNCTDFTIIDPQEIVTFVNDRYAQKKKEDILALKEYLTINYINIGYTIYLKLITDFPYMFLIQAKKQTGNIVENLYIKYYYDDREEVSSVMGIPITYFSMDELKADPKIVEALQRPQELFVSSVTV